MTNKKKIIAGASVGAFAVLAMGAFAFFTSTDTDYVDGLVGTVEVEGEGAGLHSYYSYEGAEQAVDDEGNPMFDENGRPILTEGSEDGERAEVLTLLNPGDNDNTFEEGDGHRDGTDHELSFPITNKGTKSIITRAVIMVSAVDKDGNEITDPEVLQQILLSYHGNSEYGESARTEESGEKAELTLLEPADLDIAHAENAICYVMGGHTILNGVGENAEEELAGLDGEQGITYVFDLGLSRDVDKDSPLQGGTVTITVQIQAMQYRNTADSDWVTIFGNNYTTVVGYTDHPAEGHEAREGSDGIGTLDEVAPPVSK